MRTLEQQRAAHALERVEKLQERAGGFKEDKDKEEYRKLYRSYVDRLGPTIVMNGLGQALATELAAAGGDSNPRSKAHRELYEAVKDWLCRKEGGIYPADQDLLKSITKHEEAMYLHAQAETLAWLDWHKKACRASLPRGEGNDE